MLLTGIQLNNNYNNNNNIKKITRFYFVSKTIFVKRILFV